MGTKPSIGHGSNLRYRRHPSGRAFPAIAVVVMLALAALLAVTPTQAQDESADTLWSADMSVVAYTDVSIGAASADLFSNVGGTGDLQIKWLWSFTTHRDLRLAFEEVISDTSDLTLKAGDLALEFPENSSGQNSFMWTGVDVDWEDGQTISVSIVSASAAETPQPNSPATGQPTISGTAKVNQKLTADTSGISDEDGLDDASYSYQWIRNDGTTDTDIQDATSSTYTLVAADKGKTIKVQVSFTDDNGNQESLTSAATAAVAATVPTQPLGLTVTRGDQAGDRDASWQAPSSNGGSDVTGYKVQWKEAADSWDTADDVSEATVTGTAYTVTGLTDGVEYTVRVIAVNDIGDSPASDEASVSMVQNSPATGTVGMYGIPRVGGWMAVTYSITDADGLENATLEYQWIRNDGSTDQDITGAVGFRYQAVSEDAGKTLKVRVSFNDDAGNPEALTSDPMEIGPNNPATGSLVIKGTPRVGETLTADISGIDDADGMEDEFIMPPTWFGDYDYRRFTDISYEGGGSTTPLGTSQINSFTFDIRPDHVGIAITAAWSFIDDLGTSEFLYSEPTAAVSATVPDPPQNLEVSIGDGGALARLYAIQAA